MVEYIDTRSVNQTKFKVEVVITTMNNDSIRGIVFLSESERVIDILNDSRKFIPISLSNGIIRLLNKDSIYFIEPVGQSTSPSRSTWA